MANNVVWHSPSRFRAWPQSTFLILKSEDRNQARAPANLPATAKGKQLSVNWRYFLLLFVPIHKRDVGSRITIYDLPTKRYTWRLSQCGLAAWDVEEGGLRDVRDRTGLVRFPKWVSIPARRASTSCSLFRGAKISLPQRVAYLKSVEQVDLENLPEL